MIKKLAAWLFFAALIITGLSSESRAEAISATTIKELIVKHSVAMGLDPAIALSIAKKESGFCHNKKSPYGAVGVFQLMPSTAKRMGYNPYSIHDNIKGGIAYYKMMYKMFGKIELALAAYNAGPGNVKKYNGIPPFGETKNFVSSIMKNYRELKLNPDPAMFTYKNAIKEINFKEPEAEKDFRSEPDAILEAFLANQGI